MASAVPASAADHWTDISDAQWVKTYGITAAQVATVAQGYENGGFRPSQTVTRAQLVKMVMYALGIPPSDSQSPDFSFCDVSADSYYQPWLDGAVTAGIVAAQPGDAFRPADPATREEATAPLAAYLTERALTVQGGISGRLGIYSSLPEYYAAEGPALLTGFADRQTLSLEDAPSMAYLVFLSVVQGSGNAGAVCLDPQASLTRAQAVALILRAEKFTPKEQPPAVKAVAPAFGSEAGGGSVIIVGSGFSQASSVTFGGLTLGPGDFEVRTDTEIEVPAVPAGTGSVDVTVVNKWGNSEISGGDVYTYVTTLYSGNDVVQTALAHLYVPYVWGGSGPSGFDCSGLAQQVFTELGMTLPHHAASQYPLGSPVAAPQLQPGDLVFFGDPIYHVGIYVGDGNMIDAPHTGSYVRIESIGWPDYSGACRVLSSGLLPDESANARHEQTDAALIYSGPWNTTSTASASGGSFAFANSPGTAVTIHFAGTELVWIAKKSPVYGRAEVTLDGGDPLTVDLYDANVLWQQGVWDTGALADGEHTVTIRWTGQKNAAATDTNIGIDAFEVTGSREF
jgi:hypothetical protein